MPKSDKTIHPSSIEMKLDSRTFRSSSDQQILPTMGKYRPAISSMSMGHAAAGHDLPLKLRIAKQAGFEGIEVGVA